MTVRLDAMVTLPSSEARTTTAVLAFLLVMAAAPATIVMGATGVASPRPPNVAGGPAVPTGNPSWLPGMPVFDPGLGSRAEPKEAAPRIAEWTRTAGPDDTITASGWRLSNYSGADEGRDTRYLFYGQISEPDGVWAEGLIQSIGRDKVMVTLPRSLPPNSAYLVWPGNAAGWGYPERINMAEAWWLGPENATRGDLVACFGRNLMLPGATKAWVWVEAGTGGSGQWLEAQPCVPVGAAYDIDASNPYMLKFRVPASLTNGTYRVWAHNGGGGVYGWSKGLTFAVDEGLTWNAGRTFVVKDFGAKADGATDDTGAISSALMQADATDWSTVYFPAGTYIISKGLKIGNRVRLLGEGRDRSTLKLKDNAKLSAQVSTFEYTGDEVETRALTLDGNGTMQHWVPYPYAAGLSFADRRALRFMDCRLITRNRRIVCAGAWDLRMRNVEVITDDTYFLGNTRGPVMIEGCVCYRGQFFDDDNPQGFVMWWGGQKIALSGCTIQFMGKLTGDPNPDDPWEYVNFASGRWMCEQPHYGFQGSQYLGGNRSIDMVWHACNGPRWRPTTDGKASGAGTNVLYGGPNTPTGGYFDKGEGTWKAATNSDPQWLMADLGSARTVSEVHTVFGNYATAKYQYSLETSTDGKEWTKTVGPKGSERNREYHVDAFPAREARYVRMTVTGSDLRTNAAITEMQAFGTRPMNPLSFVHATASSNPDTANEAIDGKAIRDRSPRARFAAEFVKTGPHYVWVRGRGGVIPGYLPETLALNSDSCWVGLDCDTNHTLPLRMDDFGSVSDPDAYAWRNRATYTGPSGQPVQAPLALNVTQVGMHNLDVTVCEDGFYFDKIVVTTDPNYAPSGNGPGETLSGGAFRQTAEGLLAMEAEHATSLRNPPFGPGGNGGEQIMWENWSGERTQVVAANSETIRLAGDVRPKPYNTLVSNGWSVVVVEGHGVGQSRHIVNSTFDGTNTVAHVDEPWRVTPAAGDVMHLSFAPRRVAIYANDLDGTPRAWQQKDHVACAGVQFYFGAANVEIVGNTFHELRSGIAFCECGNPSEANASPYASILIANNKFERTRWHIYSGQVASSPNGRMLNVTRRNVFDGSYPNTIDLDPSGFCDHPKPINVVSMSGKGSTVELDAEVFEHNLITNSPLAVDFGYLANLGNTMGNLLFYRNKMALGSAPLPGSAAFCSTDVKWPSWFPVHDDAIKFRQRPLLRENLLTGFEAQAKPSSPLKPRPTLPDRVVVVEVAQGQRAAGTLPVWNSGGAGMDWSVSKLQAEPWLAITPSSGTLADQTAAAEVKLTVDAAGLAVGEHEAVLELRAGDDVQRATVRAAVRNAQ